MSENIPADVMERAKKLLGEMEDPNNEDIVRHLARALLAERREAEQRGIERAATPEPRVSVNEHQVLSYITEADARRHKDYDLLRRLHLDAMDARAQLATLIATIAERDAEIARLKSITGMSLGVGDGSGQLFVYGNYESIKAAQAHIFAREAAEAALKAAREAFDTVTPIPDQPNCFTSTHALDNLEGAIIDLERQSADAVCIRTLKRIAEQLQQIEAALTKGA